MKNSSTLIFFIYAYIQFLNFHRLNLDIVINFNYEQSNLHRLETFSFIESYAIQRAISQFNDYKFDSIIIETSLGDVYINYVDETAYLHFAFENEVFAKLEYDLVYDSALAYDIIPQALFPSVDKIPH